MSSPIRTRSGSASPQKAVQSSDTCAGAHRNEMPAYVVQLARDRPCAGNAEQPFLLRHVSKALIVCDKLPSIRHIAVRIAAARVETEGHDPKFSREAAGLLGSYQPESHIRLPAAERHLLRLRREHRRSAERDLADERRMRSPGDPGNSVRCTFHRDVLIEDLLANCRQATGPRQAVDQRHTSSSVSSAACRRLTVAWSTFKARAAPDKVPLRATARK